MVGLMAGSKFANKTLLVSQVVRTCQSFIYDFILLSLRHVKKKFLGIPNVSADSL